MYFITIVKIKIYNNAYKIPFGCVVVNNNNEPI